MEARGIVAVLAIAEAKARDNCKQARYTAVSFLSSPNFSNASFTSMWFKNYGLLINVVGKTQQMYKYSYYCQIPMRVLEDKLYGEKTGDHFDRLETVFEAVERRKLAQVYQESIRKCGERGSQELIDILGSLLTDVELLSKLPRRKVSRAKCSHNNNENSGCFYHRDSGMASDHNYYRTTMSKQVFSFNPKERVVNVYVPEEWESDPQTTWDADLNLAGPNWSPDLQTNIVLTANGFLFRSQEYNNYILGHDIKLGHPRYKWEDFFDEKYQQPEKIIVRRYFPRDFTDILYEFCKSGIDVKYLKKIINIEAERILFNKPAPLDPYNFD